MNMKQEISPGKIQKDTENYYRKGFFCCEAVMASIRDNFDLDVPAEVIAMASGMAVGAGRSGCMCAWKTAEIIVREYGLKNLDL